ncbi:pseudouridine synthase [Pseudolactococcus reticulitermitis]|uniref:Pseudouridine synthase n=1 Tax=Pseudolactococcus reticulitermitis TaxID=2025039 RepID=A0A224WY52_9LACT|nr:pseudouridine synthase [Lactococcus reticulitermitis]GAX47098.1 rRNA pseudouridine synthase [Lactococcus reticulitermitis]
MRVDAVLIQYGGVKKSDIKKVLREHRVSVNGQVITARNEQVDSNVHDLRLDGRTITFPPHRYFMVNKPPRTLSANKDAELSVVFDVFPDDIDKADLYIIGRLDFLSEGLLLITDNGKLGRNLIKPEAHVEKVYQVEVKEPLDADDVRKFRAGLVIDGDVSLAPAKLVILSDHTAIVSISEGKNRQIRKMFLSVGKLVTKLVRIQIGTIQLDERLKSGDYRALTKSEIQSLAPYFKDK